MAIESPRRSAVALKLNGGIKESTGGVIIKSVSLGPVYTGADKNKIMSIVGALAPVLVYPFIRVERTEVTEISN